MHGNDRRMRMYRGYSVATVIFFVAAPVTWIIGGALRKAESRTQPTQHQEKANDHRCRTPHTSTVPLKPQCHLVSHASRWGQGFRPAAEFCSA